MATPPARLSLFPVGSLTPANAKTYFGQLYDYIYALLGADGSTAAARNAMEVPVANYLINPDGEIYQRAIAATADDVYMDDRWYALTQTGTITPSQVSNPENGYHRALRLTQSQVTAQRMGRAQIVEASQVSSLRGKTVTFGGRFKLSTSATVRYAILAWTGTADAPTSDIVNDWTNGTYTTGNFFTSTTLSLVATGSTALTAATAATCSVSGSVPAGATNIICLYWTEAVAAQNVTLDAWGLRLVDATGLVGAIRRSLPEELRLCQRYYEKSFPIGTAPAQNAGTTGVYVFPCVAAGAVTQRAPSYSFKVTKRTTPTTITCYNPSAANAFVRDNTIGADFTSTAITALGDSGFTLSGASAASAAVNAQFIFHWSTECEL